MEFEDNLQLKPSDKITVVTSGNSNVNLELEAAPALLSAKVTGTVYDTTLLGTVLGGATVTVFDSTGAIVGRATTSLLGIYLISNLEGGQAYTIVASKDGYTTSAASSFTANNLIPSTVNLVISPNTNETLNTIFGIISDNASQPLGNATVTLVDTTSGEIFSETATIDDGEYVIYNIPTGTYDVQISRQGYFSKTIEDVAFTTSQDISQDVSLDADDSSTDGVISGIITDSSSDPVPNCFVGIYTLSAGDVPETLIDYTFTNAAGRYVFSNVEPASYIIKAKLATNP